MERSLFFYTEIFKIAAVFPCYPTCLLISRNFHCDAIITVVKLSGWAALEPTTIGAKGLGFDSRDGQIGTVSPTARHRCNVSVLPAGHGMEWNGRRFFHIPHRQFFFHSIPKNFFHIPFHTKNFFHIPFHASKTLMLFLEFWKWAIWADFACDVVFLIIIYDI